MKKEVLSGYYMIEASTRVGAHVKFMEMLTTIDKFGIGKSLRDTLGRFDLRVTDVLKNESGYDVHFEITSLKYDTFNEKMIEEVEVLLMTGLSVNSHQ